MSSSMTMTDGNARQTEGIQTDVVLEKNYLVVLEQ